MSFYMCTLFSIYLISIISERRYATFKLFYTEQTPPDYEPEYFRAGDSEKEKFFFATHALEEVPEKINVGKLDTGLHGYGFISFVCSSILNIRNQRKN